MNAIIRWLQSEPKQLIEPWVIVLWIIATLAGILTGLHDIGWW